MTLFTHETFKSAKSGFTSIVFLPLLYRVLASLGLVLALWQNADVSQDAKTSQTDTTDTFDFIIVGAGSAGSVVANRLSRFYNVLLLEAGGEPNPLHLTPGLALFLLNYPETDWMHRTVPQKYGSLNSVNQQSSWSAGKALGGSGNINLLLYLRGHKHDWDNYAKITGDNSWSYEAITEHFKNLETYSDKNAATKNYHGYKGDLSVELPDYTRDGNIPSFCPAGHIPSHQHPAFWMGRIGWLSLFGWEGWGGWDGNSFLDGKDGEDGMAVAFWMGRMGRMGWQ